MTLRAGLAAVAIFLAPAAQAQGAPAFPCAETDKQCAWKAMESHATHRLDGWKADFTSPLAERIAAAPPQLVEYLTLDNIFNGFPERPRAAELDAAFLDDVRGALAELPPRISQLIGERLIGLYFVESLGGTGFTDHVKDADGKPVAGFVVLDAAVLRSRTANAWASWKENTPFHAQEPLRLDARIEDGAQDNRKNAIQYILLHELGHVLAIGSDIHPPWYIAPKDLPASASYRFSDLSWKVDREHDSYITVFDADFTQRKNVAYYFGAKLAAADMVATYANLEKTSFPSLYAATNPGDDFAEAFASYVHVVLLQRPWQVTISRSGEVLKVFKACWDEPRCADKRKVLEQILKRLD
ncbi:MAG: hypothetical protein JWQ07_3295 [Ramlibacter sp.]|nr:hypothetical protein [Ramlibacter sp.]